MSRRGLYLGGGTLICLPEPYDPVIARERRLRRKRGPKVPMVIGRRVEVRDGVTYQVTTLES